MRLEKLQVSGFGHLHGLKIDLKGPVTVLYGPNEAGKSTLLGFVRAMLFGIPSRTYGAQRYEPVNGGVHGGMLTIRDESGAQWIIERYARPPEGASLSGTKGDRLRITVSEGEGILREATQEEMQRGLLSGMSKDMFRQLFAISLTELQEVSALQSEEMNTFLFHAGIGGGSAIMRGEKKLVSEMDKLYRPKGRNQEMAQILQLLERLELDAKAVKSLLPRYHELLDELSKVSLSLSRSEEELAIRNHEASRLHRAVKCRPDWLKRESALIELEALPADSSTYPEQGIARWNTLQEEKERLLLENSELARIRASIGQEMASFNLDEALLGQEGPLRSLAERMAGYESRHRELVDVRADIKSLNDRLLQCLHSIHPDWTISHLRSFGGTIGEREAVRQYAARFAAYDKEMELLRTERFKLEREVLSMEGAYTSAAERLKASEAVYTKQFAVIAPSDRSEIRLLWSEISTELDRWREAARGRHAEQRAEEAEQEAAIRMQSMYQKLTIGAALLTIILPVILWLTTKNVWGSALGGAALLVFDLVLLSSMRANDKLAGRSKRRRGMPTPPGEELTAESRLKALVPKLIRHPMSAVSGSSVSSAAEKSGQVTIEHWEEEERLLRRMMEHWQLWAQKHEVLENELSASRSRTVEKIDQLKAQEREMSRREEAFSKLADEWEAWLEERQLPALLSPDAALDVFRLAEQGKEWQGRIENLSVKEAQLQSENEAFEREARANSTIMNSLAIPEDLIYNLRQLLPRLDHMLELRGRHEQLSAKMGALDEECSRLHDRLERIKDAEGQLLRSSGTADGEEFLVKGAQAARFEELDREIRQWNLLLHGALDQEKSEELEALLRSYDEEELIERADQARRAQNEAESRRLELQELRGRLLQELESLEARGRQEDLLQQVAEQKSLLGNTVNKYAVMAVCRELIERVRKIYEEERQPAVLQSASRYLQEMTGGVYRRILMKMGSQELLAEHREHGPIASPYLSRGTAEQLYLAMRLALSDAVSGQMKLPILLDDLFVNFDHSRMMGAMSVIKAVSEQHQVIMMTCHEHVTQAALETINDCQIITL